MAITSSQSITFESEMVPKRRVMPRDIFDAAIKGYSEVLIERLGLQTKEQTEIQIAQSELQSATRFGDTILHLLVTNRHNELALKVFEKDESLLKAHNKMLETPLHGAAKVGNHEVIQMLIQINPDIVRDALEETNENCDTVLHMAVTYGFVKISIELMKLHKELAYKFNNKKLNPLYLAIEEERESIAKAMIEEDKNLACTQFSDGMFPVHLAARKGSWWLVVHLMEKYPHYAELVDPRGRNLFHYAAEESKKLFFFDVSNNTTVREMTLRMNNREDYDGNTPLHIAAMIGNRFTIETIWKMNRDPGAVQNRDAGTVQNHDEGTVQSRDAGTVQNRNAGTVQSGDAGTVQSHDAGTVENKKGLTPYQLSRRQLLQNSNEDFRRIYKKIRAYERANDKKFSEEWFRNVMEPSYDANKRVRTQVRGLGSVLITTVTFAAAFTIPGGYNQDNGTPLLWRKYMFWAFILANTFAFILGFLSLFVLLLTALPDITIDTSKVETIFFMLAASSMILAFGLGLYVTLAPVCLPIAIIILAITVFVGSPVLLHVSVSKQIWIEKVANFLHSKKTIWPAYIVPPLLIFSLASLCL